MQLLKCRLRFLNVILKCEEYVIFKNIFVVCNSTVVIYLPEVELLSYGLWMFNFTKCTKLFSEVVVPAYSLASSFVKLYTSTSGVDEFELVCVLSSTCSGQTSHCLPIRQCEVTGHRGSNVRFSDCQWVWGSFRLFMNLAFILRNTWHIFYPFRQWVDF